MSIAASRAVRLKLKMHICKKRKLCRARKNIAKSLPRKQSSQASRDRYIFRERGAILKSDAGVHANRIVNGRFKKQQLDGGGALESQVIHIQETFEFRRQIEIRARVHQKNPRVHEVRLPFGLAGAHAGQQAVAGRESDSGAGQAKLFAVPEAENSSRKGGIVD